MRLPFALLLLAACDGRPSNEEQAQVPAGVRAACALDGAERFADCTVQRTSRDGKTMLTVIAPDGGFRRLSVATEGAGITTADGAEVARFGAGPSGEIEVAVSGDRYRLPAARP